MKNKVREECSKIDKKEQRLNRKDVNRPKRTRINMNC